MIMYWETVNMTIEITFNMPFDGLHTPRTCLLRPESVWLCNSPDNDWNHEEELKGRGLGECLLLLPYSASDNELSDV